MEERRQFGLMTCFCIASPLHLATNGMRSTVTKGKDGAGVEGSEDTRTSNEFLAGVGRRGPAMGY